MKILRKLSLHLRIVEFGAGVSVGVMLIGIGGVGLEEWRIASSVYQTAELDQQYIENIAAYHQSVQKLSQEQESHIRSQVEYMGVSLFGAIGATTLALVGDKTADKEMARRRRETAPLPPAVGVIPDTVWMPPDDPPAPGR